MVGEGDADLRALEEKAQLEDELGLETQVISGDEARRICPVLSEDVTGASYCEAEGFMNPLQVASVGSG